jgi:inner membrane protein
MEPVTHFLTGAVLSRAGFNRRTAYATLAMTLAAEAPDLDVLWAIRGPVASFQHHRGITHTLLGAPFVALAVTGTVYLWHRFKNRNNPGAPRPASGTWEANATNSAAALTSEDALSFVSSATGGESPSQHHNPSHSALKPNWFLIWLFSLIAVLSHLLLDFTNNYGLRPFFPFNPRWYSWDIVFIFEPLIFASLLGALIVPAIFALTDSEIGARRQPFRGRGWAIAALAFIAIVYGVRNAEHQRALNLMRASQTDPVVRVAAEPLPIDPFHWQGLAETANYYRTASISTRNDFVDTDSGQTIYKPPVTTAVLAAKRSYLGRVYLDWSSWPLVSDLGSIIAPGAENISNLPAPPSDWHTVQFRDLRFSSIPLIPGGTKNPPLTGWVYIGPGSEVEAMIMNGREQK